ncbi:MAG: shikimate kinase [Lachnospiraceae bacterium]|nr:shikimate kinase [Lachnospiraceae bacterium]MDD6503936.1 shikimate kinase [Lachnospiraceae bacterium]
MSNNIFLIGFMGSGKSTIGRFLQKELNMELVEMDARIVEEQGMSINDIFAEKGEDYFRDLESRLVLDLNNEGNTIVSCGGGVVIRLENVENMKKNGKIVFLSATPDTIYERVKNSTERPILNGHMNVEYIAGLMEKRRALYENAADIRIETDGKTRDEICKEIIDKL